MSYLTCVVPEPIHVRFRRLSLEGSFSLASLPKFVLPLVPGGGGTCVFLGWVCAARDSKWHPVLKKFPLKLYPVLEFALKLIPHSRNGLAPKYARPAR